jgi:predicted RNase H-like HicB family nuclease
MFADTCPLTPPFALHAANYHSYSSSDDSSSVAAYEQSLHSNSSHQSVVGSYWLEYCAGATLDAKDYSDVSFDIHVVVLDHAGRRVLSHPLTVLVEPDEGSFLAHSDTIDHVFGVGDTVEDAIRDFEAFLVDLHDDLSNASEPYSAEWQGIRSQLLELME